MKLATITVGADPEVFFIHALTKQPRSAIGLVGGTKRAPKKLADLGDGFAVQEDNVAAEYNIPPCGTAESFDKSIARGLKWLEDLASKNRLRVAVVSALHFSPEQLADPLAQVLGCEPDYNAWTKEKNPRPVPPQSLRTAAGHVHVGWSEPTQQEQLAIARGLDFYLGLPSILVTEPNERRSLYGKAGACRPKDYGVEYRTLDNFWIANSRDRRFVFQSVHTCAQDYVTDTNLFENMLQEYGDQVQNAINTHDPDMALELLAALDIPSWPVL